MDESQVLYRLALALAIGLLIGLERGWSQRGAGSGERVAGVRTFALVSLLGALWALAAQDLGVVLLAVAFLGFAVVLVAAHVLSALRHEDHGITTLVAALLTFVLGAAAVREPLFLVSATAVVTVIILGTKPILHRWVQRLEQRDVYAIFQMLLISVVLLPVLPDRGMGPWSALNPYELWLMVVLIAGVSFAGYFGIKLLGHRLGVGLISALGGLVSSTAVTLSFARMARERPAHQGTLTAGVLAGAGTMFPRTLLLAAVLAPAVARELAVPLLVMAAVCYAAALGFWRAARAETDLEDAPPGNPLELKSALSFGALLAAVMVLARALREWLGDPGVLLLGALSGLTDVDAVTLSMSQLVRTELPVALASAAVLIAAVVNTACKGLIAVVVARSRMGRQVLVALTLVALVGALTGVLTSLSPGQS